VNVLLDTHILLWALVSPAKLPAGAARAIHQAHTVFFSPLNLWEIGIKSSIWPEYGIARVDEIHAGALKANLRELPVRSADTMMSTQMPLLHRDPIDRMLLAQSHNNQSLLITTDGKLALYNMPYVLSV
jgi:PIN domain nuclease of toxin-antitoxin system